ncbi:trypsin-like peptidase domain-containing protein [Streptomyces sp. NPDC058391]|uniref:nSTAND1 domain-containing NTPase n=1 Tax=Streptomyces sp. NPDC058391 TaxID=3346476 RepID=UPI0036597324
MEPLGSSGDHATGAESQKPDEALVSSVVRIKGEDSEPIGAGFLVAPDAVLTCAHVVASALGLRDAEQVAVGAAVTLDMPLDPRLAGPNWTAQVEHCVAERDDGTGDVALLRLHAAVPGARPLPMVEPKSAWGNAVGVVGFTSTAPGGIWVKAELSGPTGEGRRQFSRIGDTAYVEKGFSGSPVWDPQHRAVVGIVSVAQAGRQAQQAFAIRKDSVVREIPELDSVLAPASPFLGLETFQESHTHVFFGRTDDTERAVGALSDARGVTLCGPSGSGKSSLALAGVVPRMRADKYDVLVVNAGDVASPLAALATELYEVFVVGRPHEPPRVRSAGDVQLWLTELGLVDTLHRVRGKAGGKLLVVLDQAEALLARDDAEVAQVVSLLFPESRPTTGLRVLLTLRADFMDEALKHAHLGPAIRSGVTLPLTPMFREQLQEAITKPLEQVPGVAYERGLVDRILDDADSGPGTLPLLGFVLKKLWEQKEQGHLLLSTYEEAGGVSGALARHAEQAWRQYAGKPEEVVGHNDAEARRLLTGLVRVLPGSSTPLRRRLTRQEAGEARWQIANWFAAPERRLLVMHGGQGEPESVELAHEALVTAWPALREQVRADSEFLAGRAELAHEHERWTKGNKASGLLPGGLQLAALEDRLASREAELNESETGFLRAARRHRQARRNKVRAGWTAAALILALIAGLGTFLVQESQVSAEREAEGRSRTLAVRSDELTGSNPGQAALAALAAYEIAPTQEARNSLLRRYQELIDAAWVLTGAEGEVLSTAMSTDGAVTLVTAQGGRATLFVRTARGRVRQEQLRLSVNVLSPVVSRDGRRIAYLRDVDGVVVWHEVMRSGKRLVGPPHPLRGAIQDRSAGTSMLGNVKIMDFSPDARRLVGVSASETARPVQVWDLETGRPQTLPKRVAHLSQVWFGSNENTLVASYNPPEKAQPSMVAVDTATGTMRELASGIDHAGAGVSGDGRVVVVCRREKTTDGDSLGDASYHAVRVADGRVLRRYERGAETSCNASAIDENGEHFAVEATTGEWDLVDTNSDKKAQLFEGPPLGSETAQPLLGTPREPVVVTQDRTAVTGWALVRRNGDSTYGLPVLLGDGSRMVVRLGEDGKRLGVVETEGEMRTVAEANSNAQTPPDVEGRLAVNRAETLVADVSDRNRITVRALPSLREKSEFTAAKPPVGEDGKPEPLEIFFLGYDQLVTVSGTRVEHWDAREGRQLSQAIDLSDLRLTTKEQPSYFVRAHHKPGYLRVNVAGEPDVHAISLRTGKESKRLRVHLGDDLNVPMFLKDPRYAAVLTKGGMVELWSKQSGQPAKRVLGSLGPLNLNQYVVGATGGSGFFLANNGSVLFLKADDPGHRQAYEFGEMRGFLAATKDGKGLLRTPESGGRLGLFRLDPALWKRHLCTVLGRDLTDDERGGLPGRLPAETCPS